MQESDRLSRLLGFDENDKKICKENGSDYSRLNQSILQ
jgi:hypothetical protein